MLQPDQGEAGWDLVFKTTYALRLDGVLRFYATYCNLMRDVF